MYPKDLLKNYTQTQIGTADGGRLVVLLYEGAVRFIDQAVAKMHFSTYDQVNVNLQKAIEIIDELRASLNHEAGGQLSARLKSIYDYMIERLTFGNMHKKKEPLLEVKGLLEELLSAWRTIAKNPAPGAPAASPNRPSLGGGLSLKG